LLSPDPDSRTEDYEGRRIEVVDGGWRLINHAKYRAKMSEAERLEYKRRKQAEYRQRPPERGAALTDVDKCGQPWTAVDKGDTYRVQSTDSKADPESEARTAPPTALVRVDDAFESFWSAYPRKVGKGATRAWWAKHRPSATETALMVASLERQRRSSQWLRDGGRYIPNPATWLNQQRWDDDPEPDVPQLSDKSVASMRATREFLGADDDRR
jgi:hypothetical protein